MHPHSSHKHLGATVDIPYKNLLKILHSSFWNSKSDDIFVMTDLMGKYTNTHTYTCSKCNVTAEIFSFGVFKAIRTDNIFELVCI